MNESGFRPNTEELQGSIPELTGGIIVILDEPHPSYGYYNPEQLDRLAVEVTEYLKGATDSKQYDEMIDKFYDVLSDQYSGDSEACYSQYVKLLEKMSRQLIMAK